MHRGNFFFMPTPSLQPDKDCSLSVLSQSLALYVQAELKLSKQYVIQSPLTRGSTVPCYLGFHSALPSFRWRWKNINSGLFIFNTVHNSKGKCIKVDLLLTFDPPPVQVSLFWIETKELGGTSAFLSAEWKKPKTLQKMSFKGQDLLKFATFSMQ